MKTLTLISLFCSSSLLAQTHFDSNVIKEKFPNDNYYFLSDKSKIDIGLRNDELEITSKVSREILFLNDKASVFTRRSIFYYDGMEQISNINAASYIKFENGKVKKYDVEKFYNQKPVKDGIFYDDLQEIYFDFPSLREDAVASFSYNQKYLDPHFIDPFYFANNGPSAEMEYSVTFPKSVSVKYFLMGDTTGIQFDKKEGRGEISYTWKIRDQKSFEFESSEGNFRKYAPHVVLYIDNYPANNKTVNVLGDLGKLYSWYVSHVAPLLNDSAQEIKLLADSLTKNLTSAEEKIKAIYYWAQENIKYIAFSNDLGGFVPRKAALVSSRRFGDCKDNTSLMFALLKACDIPSYFTWIGTREIPYRYHELPTPAACNHMILSVYQNNQWTYLDGTSTNLPFGYPSGFIQEKEALIGLSIDSFLVKEVPVVAKEKNFHKDVIVLKIENENLRGKNTSLFGGLWRNSICGKYENIPVNKRKEEMKDFLRFGSTSCIVDSVNYVGLDGYSDTLQFEYNFSIPNYVRKIDNKLYVNMNLNKVMLDDKIEIHKRKTPLVYNYKFCINESIILEIPTGYVLFQKPEHSTFNGKEFGFEINYFNESGKIGFEKYIYFDDLEITKDQFAEWNSMIEKLISANLQVVVLEKK